MIIISFIAYYHCDDRDLVAQVGFAASISSIILSVLAIIVTVVSNGSMDKLAHGMYGLKDVPTDVKKSTDDAIKKITDTTESLNKASENNNQGIKEMQSRFENLFQELEQHVEDKLQTNAEQVLQMVNDMQVTANSSLAQTTKSSEKDESGEYALTDDVVDNLMERNSLAGFALFYVIDKYLEKGLSVPFDLKKMDDIYKSNTFSQYFYGYLILLFALKLCDFTQPSRDKLEFIFIDFNPKVRTKYQETFGKREIDHNIFAQIDAYIDALKNKTVDGEKK